MNDDIICAECNDSGIVTVAGDYYECSNCAWPENSDGDSVEYDAWVLASAGWGTDEDYL